VGAAQPALFVHCEPVDDGWQVPCESQVKPMGQGIDDEHSATHWPLSQTLPGAQSLLYVQTLPDAVHVPLEHTRPEPQSPFVVHGQGPFSPPHVTQWPW
jgi:hypothetical protein